MISEWMKVMLEEISRKKAEAEQSRLEEQRRREEQRQRGEQGRGEEAMTAPRSGTDRARG
jgi:hypothetical protein